MTELTKAELIERVAELEAELAAKGTNMRTRVRDLIDSGVNSIDDLASNLSTTNKNISSVLTALRKDLSLEGKTIITQVHNGKSMIAVIELSILGW